MALTPGQIAAREQLAKIQSESAKDWTPTAGNVDATSGVTNAQWANATFNEMMSAPEGTYSNAAFDRVRAQIAATEAQGYDALGEQNYQDQLQRAQANVKWWDENPNGNEMSFMDKVMGEVFPMVVGGFMTGGALSAMGLTGAAGTLAGSATKAATGMGATAITNSVNGRDIGTGVLKAGLTGGLGSYAGGATSSFVGDGLKSLGLDADTIKSLSTPITTGTLSAGTNLLQGKGLGDSLMSGIQSGAASYGGGMANSYLKDLDLGKPATDLLSGASKGAISSLIKGGDVGSGIMGGAVNGAIGYGSSLLGSSLSGSPTTDSAKAPVPNTGNKMDDIDGTDWLGSLYSNLNDPYDFSSATGFTNYGLPDEIEDTYNIDDAFSIPDYLGDYLSPSYMQDDTPNTTDNPGLAKWLELQGSSGMDTSAIANILKAAAGATGSAGGVKTATGTPAADPAKTPSFLDNLLKQLGGVGTAASNNPLAALSALMGAAGTIRNATGNAPSDLGKVDALMQQGSQQMNSAPVQSRGQIAARDPRFFTQQYAPGQGTTPISTAPAVGPLTQFGG